MARDRQTIQRLQQSKAERDRAAHMLKTERMRAQAEQTAQMQRQEGQYRRQTSNLIAQRIRERQMRQSESLLQMTFGARMSGSRLRALAGQLSLYAAQTKLGIREAFERMMQRRLQRDIMWSEADLASFESGLNSWALQRGYERDRFADQ